MDADTTDPTADHATIVPEQEWALVEIMGHRRHYGRIAEVSRFGAVMLQVDEPTAEPAIFNRFYCAASALFALTPCSEADARMGAERMRPKPWVPYRQPALRYRRGERANDRPSRERPEPKRHGPLIVCKTAAGQLRENTIEWPHYRQPYRKYSNKSGFYIGEKRI